MLITRFNALDKHSKELLKVSVVAFLFKILATVLAFGLNVILARQLGAEGTGIYFLSVTIVVIAATFGRVGMENSLVRFVSANIAASKPEKVLGVYRKAMMYSLSATIIISLILFLLTPVLSQIIFDKPELEHPLALMALSVVPLALFTLHGYALQGLKKIAESVTVLSVVVPLVTSITALVFVPYYGIMAAVWGNVLATLMALVLGRWLWKRVVTKYDASYSSFDRGELLESSLPLLVVVVMNMAIVSLPTLFMGVWETSENVGIYGAASRTAMLTGFVLVAVNSIAAPKFSALYQEGNIDELGKLARNATKIMIVFSLPALLLFLFVPEWVLALFGDDFRQGSIVLMILAFGQFVNVATGSVGVLLMMSGNERVMRNILVFSAFLSVVLNVWLISSYGMVGAAIGTAIVLSLQNVIAMIFVWRKLHILTFPRIKLKF